MAAGEPLEAAATRLGATERLELGSINSLRPLPPPVREAREGLAAGTVSGPVKAGDGYIALFADQREDFRHCPSRTPGPSSRLS